MSRARLASVLAATALVAGCEPDRPTAPAAAPHVPAAPAFTIRDGATGGNAHFYFLPPLVSAPAYSGTFDGTRSPTVRVCVWLGAGCGAVVATLSGAQVKVDASTEAYVASWKTKAAQLDPLQRYRLQVLVGTQVLGFADLAVVAKGGSASAVDPGRW